MNKKKIMSILLCVVIVIFISIAFFEIVPIVKEKDIKTRVFKDMESKSSEPMRAVVGIMPESEKDGLTSHNGIGSGVLSKEKKFFLKLCVVIPPLSASKTVIFL